MFGPHGYFVRWFGIYNDVSEVVVILHGGCSLFFAMVTFFQLSHLQYVLLMPW